MITLIHLPIEPFPQRYSEDWLNWYRQESQDCMPGPSFQEEFILGEFVYKEIEHGSFLDVTGTMLYKSSQMSRVIEWIQSRIKTQDWENTVFFFHDLWHPGVIDLFYIRNGMELPFKIVGMLHAGSYDEYDFLNIQCMTPWAEGFERSVFNYVDKIFVATEFHKELLTSTRVSRLGKIDVTGFPIYPRPLAEVPRDLDIVFPHRLDYEKQPHVFDALACKLSCYTCEKTDLLKMSKPEYFRRLNRYKVAVSFALQETWGIAMQECVFAGCLPVVPDRLSYSEMYPELFKYSDLKDCVQKINYFIRYRDRDEVTNAWCELYNTLALRGRQAIPLQKEKIKDLCQ